MKTIITILLITVCSIAMAQLKPCVIINPGIDRITKHSANEFYKGISLPDVAIAINAPLGNFVDGRIGAGFYGVQMVQTVTLQNSKNQPKNYLTDLFSVGISFPAYFFIHNSSAKDSTLLGLHLGFNYYIPLKNTLHYRGTGGTDKPYTIFSNFTGSLIVSIGPEIDLGKNEIAICPKIFKFLDSDVWGISLELTPIF